MNTPLHYAHLSIILMIFVLSNSGCINSSDIRSLQTLQPVSTTAPTVQTIPTPTPPIFINTSCWPTEQLQKTDHVAGSLIVSMRNNGNDKSYIWDISSFHTKSINWDKSEGKTYASPNISRTTPDGNFLLSFLPNKESNSVDLTLTSPNNVLSVALPVDNYSYMYLTDGKILVASETNRNIKSKKFLTEEGFTDIYYIFDPAINNLSPHSVFLPNFTPGYKEKFLISYSPNGRYVLYHSEMDNESGYSLLNISLNQVVWTLPEPNYHTATEYYGDTNTPVWNPDSSSLMYTQRSNDKVEDPDFYNISLDGTISQTVKIKKLMGNRYSIYSQPRWSPNSQYMVTTVNANNDMHLIIWDSIGRILAKPCGLSGINYWPEWSFNSKYVLVRIFGMGTPTPSGAIGNTWQYMIVDISNHRILKLPENLALPDETATLPYTVDGWSAWEIP